MNAFEMELKKILSQSKEAAHTTYVGRAAYIQVAPELRAKLEFVSLNIANQYNALKLTVLNRIDGAVDINILRFGDLLGKKMVSNPNFSDGVIPHLWDDYGKVSWYVYQPEQADYKLLAGVVDEYLQIFQNQEEAQENIPQMCWPLKLREVNKNRGRAQSRPLRLLVRSQKSPLARPLLFQKEVIRPDVYFRLFPWRTDGPTH